MPDDKIVMRTVIIDEGEGDTIKKWESSLDLTDERLWTFIMDTVNNCNQELEHEYRYLGHFITKNNTIEPKTTGSFKPGKYFFDWCLSVMMEREMGTM